MPANRSKPGYEVKTIRMRELGADGESLCPVPAVLLFHIVAHQRHHCPLREPPKRQKAKKKMMKNFMKSSFVYPSFCTFQYVFVTYNAIIFSK